MIELIKKNHHNIYFIGLLITAIGLPFSNVLMSSGQIMIFVNWLVEGKLKSKWKDFLKNKTALVISSLFLLHLIGLFYTTDFGYAYKDIKTKIPILIVMLVVSTSVKLNEQKFRALLITFIAAVLASTFASIYIYFTTDFVDIRDICIFVSHIRLSLLICLSAFILIYFIFFSKEYSRLQKTAFVILILWLLYFLVILESITGLSIFFITAALLLIIEIFRRKNIFYKIILLVILVVVPCLLFFYIHGIYKKYFSSGTGNKEKLEKVTALGNPYTHDTLRNDMENGHYVWLNVCDEELRNAWNKRSSIFYDSLDRKNQYIKHTLIRFLTSKGYQKDAEGVSKLTPYEIHSIENGVANVICLDENSLSARIFETIWEYENYKMTSNPNGHSVMQRLAYWKASLEIIKEHLWFGVGTGDMNIAFQQQYDKMNSPLDKKWRLRSHDQFLSITVGFGLFGLLWFLITLFYPFTVKWVRSDYFYLVFFAIAMLSMVTEDTIESQAGLTFFVFFNSVFLFCRKK